MKKLMFALLSLSTLAAFGAIRSVTPKAWNNDPNCWQMKRHRDQLKAVANGGAEVVFIGDSITHFWERAGKPQWQKYFASGKYRALNLGTAADRTEHVLWRLTEGKELDGYEAKCILLMIGTNNSGQLPFAEETPLDTVEGVRRILKVIAEKQPKARTILTSIFPRGYDDRDPIRQRNEIVNGVLSQLADGKKVIWCDFSDKYLDRNGVLSRELFPDLLHPSARGYEIWASAVLPLIDRVLAAAPEDTIPSVWPAYPRGYAPNGLLPVIPHAEYDREGSWWTDGVTLGHRNAVADDSNKEYDIVWVGDSITHRWVRQGGEGRELWLKLRKKYHMLNLGIGGDRVENVLWRMKYGELEGYKAKVFMLMIGTNNNGQDTKAIAEGIRKIIAEITTRHPESKLVLMPIFPRSAKSADAPRVANEKVNAIIKAYADGQQVRWLDFNAKFLQPDGTLTREVMNDLLHPNERGYQIWWESVEPTIRTLTGK